MSHIGQRIELTSSEFPPCEEDAELVNNHVMHGYALSRFIAEGLEKRGYGVAGPIPEDWGWYNAVKNADFTLWYGCSSYDLGDEFVVIIEPSKPIIRRWFRKIDVSGPVNALNEAIFSILATSGKVSKGPDWVD